MRSQSCDLTPERRRIRGYRLTAVVSYPSSGGAYPSSSRCGSLDFGSPRIWILSLFFEKQELPNEQLRSPRAVGQVCTASAAKIPSEKKKTVAEKKV